MLRSCTYYNYLTNELKTGETVDPARQFSLSLANFQYVNSHAATVLCKAKPEDRQELWECMCDSDFKRMKSRYRRFFKVRYIKGAELPLALTNEDKKKRLLKIRQEQQRTRRK